MGLFRQSRNQKKRNKKTGKKWLFKEIIFGHGSAAGLSYIPIQIVLNIDFNDNLGVLKAIFFSMLIVSMALCEYIILVIIPSKAEQYLNETYPEYGMVEKNQ